MVDCSKSEFVIALIHVQTSKCDNIFSIIEDLCEIFFAQVLFILVLHQNVRQRGRDSKHRRNRQQH